MQCSINSTFDPINSVMTNSALKCLDFSSFVSSWPFVSISIKKRPRCVCILNSLCALLLEVTLKKGILFSHIATFPTYLWVTIKGHKDQDLNVDLDLHDSKELCFQKDGWQHKWFSILFGIVTTSYNQILTVSNPWIFLKTKMSLKRNLHLLK